LGGFHEKVKKIISLLLTVVMTVSVFFIMAMPASAKDADGYTVVLLDISSSMLGSPLDSLKDVAKRFCASLLGADSVNRIAIVTYATNVQSNNFTDSYSELKGTIDQIENPEFESLWDRIRWSSTSGRSSTNIYDALITAASLLNGVPSSASKNIILMTDGQPVTGATSEEGPYGNTDTNAKYANAIYYLMQEYMLLYNVYTVGFFHSSQNDLATKLLSDINNKGFYNAQNEDNLIFMFSDVANSIKKTVPTTYDFYRDSYNFTNYSKNIDNTYFETLYGKGKGKAFDLWRKNARQGGMCFGMTYTTASLINGFPSHENIRGIINKQDEILNWSLSTAGIKIGDKSISIDDYIKYAHIYQFSADAQNNQTWADIDTIYNKVKTYLDNNQIGVTIGMTRRDGTGGHRVLAVGIDGDDILIDDPNNKDNYERITCGDYGAWEFSGLSGWNNNTCYIRYSVDYYVPYSLLLTGKTVSADPAFTDADCYVYGMDQLDTDKLLLTVDCDSYSTNTTTMSEIIVDDINNENATPQKLFWVTGTNSVTFNDVNGENNFFSLAGNKAVLSVKTQDTSDVTIIMNEGTDVSSSINTTAGNSYEIDAVTFDETREINVTITGIANGELVEAKQTEFGFSVSGLNDISIVYSDADMEIAKTAASVTDGRTVNITVDDENDTVSTDFVDETDTTETPVDPATPDPIPTEKDHTCKYCGQDHGTSFWGRFEAFFHKIAYFFSHLFGKN